VTARVLGPLEGWVEGLAETGVHLQGEQAGRPPDLVVAPAADAARAAALRAPMVLLEARGRSAPLHRRYPAVERFLAVPSVEEPVLLVPLGHDRALRYAIGNWSLAHSLGRRVRNRLARSRPLRRALPIVRPLVTVASLSPGPPFMIAAARAAGVDDVGEWFLTFGSADALTRGVFHVFRDGADEPAWVVKFARVRGYTAPFDRDARGLAVADGGGDAVRARAPRLLGRFEVDGLAASVESAAVGARLTHLLLGRAPRTEKERAIEAVAAWTLDVARSTARGPEELAAERRRLAEEVVPRWHDHGVPPDLVDRIGPVPGVLQHNDLGSWNVVARSPAEFTAVDWESGRAVGLPLWDIVYFLADALTHLDGASTSNERRDEHNLRLFRGELPSSEILFRWLRRTVEALAIPNESVGPIVTLCWLHHGLSGGARRATADLHTPGDAAAQLADAERIARLWLRGDGLGPGWSAWQRGR